MSAREGAPALLPVVIGVSGHRTLRPQDIPALEASVSQIFAEMHAAWPRTPLVVVSPCADGADQLVARVALRHGAELIALLPMPRALYEADFTGSSLEEFRVLVDDPRAQTMEVPLLPATTPKSVTASGGEDRNLQYLRMGTFLARHCQVLIALWNGKLSAEVGGTAQIVAFKRTGRLELPSEMRARMESDQEPFRYRRTPLDAPETGVIHHVLTPAGGDDVPDGSVGERRILRPDGITTDAEAAAFDRRNEEIGARVESFNVALARLDKDAPPVPGTLRDLPEDLAKLRDFLARTDRVASRLQVWTFRTLMLLCTSAFLAAAAFGAFAHLTEGRPLARERFLLAYLALLGLATGTWALARSLDLQDRFQDTRAVAEGLRVQLFWRLAGLSNAAADHYLRKQRSDLDWIRNAVRFFGFTTRPASPPRISAVFDGWITDQVRYYRDRMEIHRRAGERLHALSRSSLALSLLLAVGWGVVAIASTRGGAPHARSEEGGLGFGILVFAVSLLAVLAGLFHVVNETGAHGAHARQYGRMLSFFLAARADLADPQRGEPGPTLLELGKEALAENGDWVLLHRERPLEVPHTA